MKKGCRRFGLFCCLLFFALFLSNEGQSVKARTVDTFGELKQCLSANTSETIVLGKSIAIKGSITIRGKKVIDGKGNTLFRSREKGSVYGGTLFLSVADDCEWKNVTISGESDKSAVKGKVFGRLLEVKGGKVVLSRCHLKNNRNTSLAVDGGGALLVTAGRCHMKAGSIEGNRNVSCGGAVRIEKSGTFYMSGGVMTNNRVDGVAGVSGFDGRGGAIYNAGTLRLESGTIKNNTVRGYRNGDVVYGGVGGAIYNEGTCLIAGGVLSGNQASLHGAAIYTTSKATLTIRGGEWKGNGSLGHADKEIWVGGMCRIGESPQISSLYLAKNSFLTIEKSVKLRKNLLLELSSYVSGRRVTKGKKVRVSLANGSVSLVYKRNGYFVQKEEKKVVYKETKEAEKKVKHRVVKNKAPVVKSAHRYFFLREVKRYTKKMWLDCLWEGCMVKDDISTKQKLKQSTTVECRNFDGNSGGEYRFRLCVKDRHKSCAIWIRVTIVDEAKETNTESYVQFVPPDGKETTCCEEWYFGKEDIERIQMFLDSVAEPFSQRTNEQFMERYRYCKQGEGEGT